MYIDALNRLRRGAIHISSVAASQNASQQRQAPSSAVTASNDAKQRSLDLKQSGRGAGASEDVSDTVAEYLRGTPQEVIASAGSFGHDSGPVEQSTATLKRKREE